MSGRRQDNPTKTTIKEFVRLGSDAKATVEDLPKLRSVPLLSSRGPCMMQAPPLGISKPIPGIVSTIHYNSPPGSIGGSFYAVQKEWVGSVVSPAPETWVVQLEDLKPIPPFFPLENTHREITEEPTVIASRISKALSVLSIQTEFCKKMAKAKCQTNDCVSFRIRMYAGSDIGVPVIVEIQRRSGAPASFMRTCRVLLDAASQGKIPTTNSTTALHLPLAIAHHPFASTHLSSILPNLATPVQHMKCLENVPNRLESTNVMESLDTVIRLLSGDNQDAKIENELLALEHLICLTDPQKSATTTVLETSEAVLFQPEMRDCLLQQALTFKSQQQQQHDPVVAADDVAAATCDGIATLLGRKRQLAYAVFANSIESSMSKNSGGLLSMTMDGDSDHVEWFSTRLIPAVVAALHEAPEAACVAYQASRCATLLASLGDSLRSVLRSHRGVLEQAHEFGRRRNELLRNQVWACLELLS